jgi:hypothetical protein
MAYWHKGPFVGKARKVIGKCLERTKRAKALEETQEP